MNDLNQGDGNSELDPGGPVNMKHPQGLWVLFITEMWERFSYYGMRALLVLYLIQSTQEALANGEANTNPGFGWSEESAYLLYGFYTWAVYLTPIFGGWLADKFLGTHRSMLIGGWIIAAGHITLACTEFFGTTVGEAVTMQTGPGALVAFITGLVLIIIGTGFFKPCVSVMVGQLYGENDPRRDSGFTIFYMGINLGAFFSPLVAGSLGQIVGWHWGFGSAAVGMIAGLFFYQKFRPQYLTGIGDPPKEKGSLVSLLLAAALIGAIALIAYGLYKFVYPVTHPYVFWGCIIGAGIAVMTIFIMTKPVQERGPLGVIFILAFIGNIAFWTAFEQAGSSMNVFAEQSTNRPLPLPDWFREFCQNPDYGPWYVAVIIAIVLLIPLYVRYGLKLIQGRWKSIGVWTLAAFGIAVLALGIWKLVHPESLSTKLGLLTQFPATWYQSVNPLAIIIFAPGFAWLWVFLNRRKLNPSTPMKFAWGLYLLGLAFIAMIFGAMRVRDGGLAGPHWLLITYVIYTWGELCLSPVGLSMVTKLAPKRLQSLMMGMWFFSFSLANLCGGLVARFSIKFTGENPELNFLIPGLPGFFLLLVIVPLGVGVFIMLISPILRRMMHGIH